MLIASSAQRSSDPSCDMAMVNDCAFVLSAAHAAIVRASTIEPIIRERRLVTPTIKAVLKHGSFQFIILIQGCRALSVLSGVRQCFVADVGQVFFGFVHEAHDLMQMAFSST